MNEAVDLARQIRKNGQFTAANVRGTFSLDDLATSSLDKLRANGWGASEEQGMRTDDPFTIFTVVQGQGIKLKVEPDEDIQRALDRVTRWRDDDPPLVDLENVTLPFKEQGDDPCNVFYAAKAGRAVWFPSLFMLEERGKSLAYHRNLTLTSLQVVSLSGLIRASYEKLDSLFPTVHSECLRRALDYLERLYGGPMTYHTHSARAQIDMDDGLTQVVNEVRAFWNLDPLAAQATVS